MVLPARKKTASPDALSGQCQPEGGHCCSTLTTTHSLIMRGWPPVTDGAL